MYIAPLFRQWNGPSNIQKHSRGWVYSHLEGCYCMVHQGVVRRP